MNEPTESGIPEAPASTPSMVERIEALEGGTVATGESINAAADQQDRLLRLEQKVEHLSTALAEAAARIVELESAAPAVEATSEPLVPETTE